MALKDYETAVEWSRDILNVVSNRFHAAVETGARLWRFRAIPARSPRTEKQTLLDWLSGDMPEGDPADLPDRHRCPTGEWALGQPDIVLQMAQSFTPPIGQDVYRCFVIPQLHSTEDTDMSAIDFIPGNRQIVHHIIVYQDTTGEAQKLDGADGQPGYTCFGGPGIDLSFRHRRGGRLGARASARLSCRMASASR